MGATTYSIMKIVYAATLVFGSAYAGFADMKQDFQDLAQRYVRGLLANGQPLDRAISEVLTGDNFDRINEYACWCYFEDDHGRGKGKPLNGVDHYCKKLHDGYDCCMLDFEEATGNDSCIPWKVRYLPGVGNGEANLVFNLFIAGGAIDDSFNQANGFDEKANCPLKEGIQDTERACCGEAPNRFPYKPLSGERSCCGGATYDTTLQECCGDDVARIPC